MVVKSPHIPYTTRAVFYSMGTSYLDLIPPKNFVRKNSIKAQSQQQGFQFRGTSFQLGGFRLTEMMISWIYLPPRMSLPPTQDVIPPTQDVTTSHPGCHYLPPRMSLPPTQDVTTSHPGCHYLPPRMSLPPTQDVTTSHPGCHYLPPRMSLANEGFRLGFPNLKMSFKNPGGDSGDDANSILGLGGG